MLHFANYSSPERPFWRRDLTCTTFFCTYAESEDLPSDHLPDVCANEMSRPGLGVLAIPEVFGMLHIAGRRVGICSDVEFISRPPINRFADGSSGLGVSPSTGDSS